MLDFEFFKEIEVAQADKDFIDFIDEDTGARIVPGYPRLCEGNGSHKNFECLCDECDYLMQCYNKN